MTGKKNSPFWNPLPAIGILAIIAATTYLVIRGILLYRANYSVADGILAGFLLAAECFIMVHSIGYTVNILRVHGKRPPAAAVSRTCELDPEHLPSVAVLVAAKHEPREVLERTFLTIQNMDYGNKKVYFLDDSLEAPYKEEAEAIARDFGLELFRRTQPWHGAKAGIVNDCLKTLPEKYIVIFDADQNPMPDFLKVLVPLMEADEKMAFIQTPQFYSNIDENPIARAAVLQQAVFYEYICEGKGVSDAMFCCGTNVIFRARALKDVGGMDESTVTEDFATSLRLHSKGYRSLYYSHVCAFGMGPEDLTGYFKQQFRWAAGTLGVFKKVLSQFLRRPFSLKPVQWAEYFLSSTYYFVGCAFSILMVCPVIFIFWEIPSFFANPEVYLLAFLPYMILTMSIFYFALRNRNYKPTDLVLGQLLGAATFFVYTKAAVAALLGIKISFGVTSKLKGGAVPYRSLWPQMMAVMVNFIAVVWAVNRFVYEHDYALLVNAFWAFYHFLVFSSIFYFNRGTE
jgi:cellulose synthase (UDP-forming)